MCSALYSDSALLPSAPWPKRLNFHGLFVYLNQIFRTFCIQFSLDLAEKALQCAKTCQICCERVEHGCEDDSSKSSVHPVSRRSSHAAFVLTSTLPTLRLAYGIDCQEQKAKCKASEWAAVMTAACGRTCGHCGAGSCRDNIHECLTYKTVCRDYTYRTFMSQNCARTCNLCGQRDNGSAQPQQPPSK